jgi:hypothetical protein
MKVNMLLLAWLLPHLYFCQTSAGTRLQSFIESSRAKLNGAKTIKALLMERVRFICSTLATRQYMPEHFVIDQTLVHTTIKMVLIA